MLYWLILFLLCSSLIRCWWWESPPWVICLSMYLTSFRSSLQSTLCFLSLWCHNLSSNWRWRNAHSLLVHQLAYKHLLEGWSVFCCLFRVMTERRGWLWLNCWLNSLEQKTLNWPLRIAHFGSAFWEGQSFLLFKKLEYLEYLSFKGLWNSDFLFVCLPKVQWHPCSCETGVCEVC